MVTDANGNTATSDAATLTIGSVVTITEQPKDAMVAAGTQVSFKVVATGDGLTYQWQTKVSATSSWANTGLTGAQTATLTFAPNAAFDGRQYRCVVTDANGNTATSDAATLTVNTSIILNDVTYEPLTSTTCVLVSYAGSASSLVIPETVEGMTVTEIGEEAFMDNKSLLSIDLPDTITVIRARAFKNCSNLSEMK